MPTPRTERVLKTPLRKRRDGDEIVVEVLDDQFKNVELKRFKPTTDQ